MSIEADRAARRARVRARIAAENAGTTLATIEVRADEVREGDWLLSIAGQHDATGRLRVRGYRYGQDGSRATRVAPYVIPSWALTNAGMETGEVVIEASDDGHEGLRVPGYVLVTVRRRVAVDA